jgi:O-antigen ligase
MIPYEKPMSLSLAADVRRSLLRTAGWGAAGTLLGVVILLAGLKAATVLGLGLFCVIMARPRIGLFLTILVIFTLANPGIFGPEVGDVFCKLAHLLVLMSLVAVTWHFFTRRLQAVLTRATAVFLLFCLMALGSALYASNPQVARDDLLHFVPFVCLYLLIIHLIKTPKQVEKCVLLVFIVSAVAAAVAILQYVLPSYHVDTSTWYMKFGQQGAGIIESLGAGTMRIVRVSGTLWHPDWLALFLVTTLPFNLYIWRQNSSRVVKVAIAAVTAMELAALVLTFTRMSFLGLLFVLALACYKRLLRPSRVLAALVPAALIGFLLLPAGYKARVLSPVQLKASDSISSRMLLQTGGLRIFKGDWLLGVGYGNYGVEFHKQSNWLTDLTTDLERLGSSFDPNTAGAHNMYLEVAVETGVVGLTLLIIALYLCVKRCRQLERHYRLANMAEYADLAAVLQISLLAFLFLAVFLHALDQKILAVLMGLSVAFEVATWPDHNLLARPRKSDNAVASLRSYHACGFGKEQGHER